MLAWLLDAITSGLSRLYVRPLGHYVAIVFLVARLHDHRRRALEPLRIVRCDGRRERAAHEPVGRDAPAGDRLRGAARRVPGEGVGARDPGLVVAWLINLFPL